MSRLFRLLQALDQLIVSLIERCLPVGRGIPTSWVDIFYGMCMSAIAIALVQPPSPDTAGLMGPPPRRPSVQEIAQRFAPQVRLDPKERYFPSSVSWYLDRTHMRLDVDSGRDISQLADRSPHGAMIPTLDLDGTRSSGAAGSRDFLQISNDADEPDTRAGDMNSARTYVHLRQTPADSATYDVQYWFFFPYSGPMIGGLAGGAHEGDWEHVTVRVDEQTQRVDRVYFAAHEDEGRWVDASQIKFQDDTHPVVYTARSSHASYPEAGLHARGILPADRTADGGVVWETWHNPRVVADNSGPRANCDWLSYPGRWGEVGAMFSGPRGPAFQAYWHDD